MSFLKDFHLWAFKIVVDAVVVVVVDVSVVVVDVSVVVVDDAVVIEDLAILQSWENTNLYSAQISE